MMEPFSKSRKVMLAIGGIIIHTKQNVQIKNKISCKIMTMWTKGMAVHTDRKEIQSYESG